MAENSEWDVVYRRLIAEGRESVDPPTAAEVEALFGEALSDEDAARVRDRLVYYPEMARVMTQLPPPEEIQILTDAERAEDWAAIKKAIAPPIPIRRPRLRAYLAYAAAAALVLAGIVFYVASRPAAPSGTSKPPLVAEQPVERRELQPDAVLRGNEPAHAIVLAVAEEYILELLTIHETHYRSYKVDIVDLDSHRVTWTRSGIPDPPNGVFEVRVSSQQLRPGRRYQLVVYGGTDQVATYTVRVKSPSGLR